MSRTMTTRIARLEGHWKFNASRSFVIDGGAPEDLPGFLKSFGVTLTPQDAVIWPEGAGAQSGGMKLTSCDDMSVVLAYVAKHGKSLVSTLRDRNGRF